MSCTIGLLQLLVDISYSDHAEISDGEHVATVKLTESIDDDREYFVELVSKIEVSRYKIQSACGPRQLGGGIQGVELGEVKSGLGYVVAVPDLSSHTECNAPVIIAYRGTVTSQDCYEDLRILVTGLPSEAYRHTAFRVYQKVREQNPSRPIVLVGHSLGGNIAQYAALRAMDLGDHNLYVRVFNSAPLRTIYERVLVKHPHLREHFGQIRLNYDPVSMVGKFFSSVLRVHGHSVELSANHSYYISHLLHSLHDKIPDMLAKVRVGTGINSLDHLNEIIILNVITYCNTWAKYSEHEKSLLSEVIHYLTSLSGHIQQGDESGLSNLREAILSPPEKVTLASDAVSPIKELLLDLKNRVGRLIELRPVVDDASKSNTSSEPRILYRSFRELTAIVPARSKSHSPSSLRSSSL